MIYLPINNFLIIICNIGWYWSGRHRFSERNILQRDAFEIMLRWLQVARYQESKVQWSNMQDQTVAYLFTNTTPPPRI